MGERHEVWVEGYEVAGYMMVIFLLVYDEYMMVIFLFTFDYANLTPSRNKNSQ